MSISVGAVEKIPNARYCAVASRSKTVTLPGNTLIESRGSAAGEFVTVMVPVAVITLAGVEPEAGFVNSAVRLVVPALTPSNSPGAFGQKAGIFPEAWVQTVATVGRLVVHPSCGELVTSSWRPEVKVATAISWPGWPVAEIDIALGTTVSEETCSDPLLVTVKVIAPVTTLPSGFDAMAVMAAAPWLTAVTSPSVAAVQGRAEPVVQTVATPGLLEVHVTG
jgi:hypothetical protein